MHVSVWVQSRHWTLSSSYACIYMQFSEASSLLYLPAFLISVSFPCRSPHTLASPSYYCPFHLFIQRATYLRRNLGQLFSRQELHRSQVSTKRWEQREPRRRL